MLADALGRPLRFIITGGQVHDATQASALLEGQAASAVIADKAYDSNGFREQIAVMNAEAVIPSKRNRKVFIPARPGSLQRPKPYRAMLQSPQTFSSFRNALRSQNHPFHRLHLSRSSHDLDRMNVD